MVARLRQRRSRIAGFSSRLALLALPVLAAAMIGRALGRLDDWSTLVVTTVGFAMAFLALLSALLAFAAIWRDGRKGLGAALRGFLLSLAVLAFPAVAGLQVASTPWLPDVASDPYDPPLLIAARNDRPEWARPVAATTELAPSEQRSAFPSLGPHRFPGDPVRVFDAALALAEERGWRILDSQPPLGFAEVPEEAPIGDVVPIPRPRPGTTVYAETPEVIEAFDIGMIEAVATTTLFAFSEDVAIRIRAEEDETVVDMRSASRFFAHDLGSNARRISSFLNELDARLASIEGN